MTGSNAGRSSVFIDGTEVLGFIVYGLWSGDLASTTEVNDESLPVQDATLRPFRLFGDGWTILGYDVGFHGLAAYQSAISKAEILLDSILDLGAHVAWMGYEGLPFADPPDLFTSEWMEGGVLAGKTRDGIFRSGIDTTSGHFPLDLHQMSCLESAAASCYTEGKQVNIRPARRA